MANMCLTGKNGLKGALLGLDGEGVQIHAVALMVKSFICIREAAGCGKNAL